ncbi:MAG: hypothetical protein LBP55_03405 [Candidatus Adiutrix sp.]|jgi:hypothetical protein|nr:hypothetical protein [Candidatus Adiutrix sp.]
MKKYIPLLLAVMVCSACAMGEWLSLGPVAATPRPSASPAQQLSDGRAAFKQKLGEAPGKTLARIKKEWGALEKGPSHGDMTGYTWRQTARLTVPAGEANPANPSQPKTAARPQTASCMAMFIVNNDEKVLDATSEGQCFDYRLMPAWQPSILGGPANP